MAVTVTAMTIALLLPAVISSVLQINPSTISRGAKSNITAFADNSVNHTVGEPRIHCDGSTFRRNLRETSCIDAWATIPDDRTVLTFGNRALPGHWGVNLPARWISDDGRCIFDINIVSDTVVDSVSLHDFKVSAYGLIQNCISGAGPSEGGIMTGLGQHGRLGLTMTSNNPRIRCSNPLGQPPGNCDEIMERMPADRRLQFFGPAGIPGVDVGLPRQISNGDRSCVLSIDTTGSLNYMSWYEVWEQMVALEGICTSNNKEGMAFRLGSSRNVFLEVKKGVAVTIATS